LGVLVVHPLLHWVKHSFWASHILSPISESLKNTIGLTAIAQLKMILEKG